MDKSATNQLRTRSGRKINNNETANLFPDDPYVKLIYNMFNVIVNNIK